MPNSALDPRHVARAFALQAAENPDIVGEFVEVRGLCDNVSDFRFDCLKRGYEGWQWSVTLYHDEERDIWTVDETSLLPTSRALLAPAWIPWKDRLKPKDIAVTDALGTEPADPRLEPGYQADAETKSTISRKSSSDSGDHQTESEPHERTTPADIEQAVDSMLLSRRHVLTALGRDQASERWYQGQHGPKSLSTRVAEGNTCSTCGFFVPLRGDLGAMFGVCANLWSPDDGRAVSIDHGCGEHSEIDPPPTPQLWVQSEPALDDMHIDVIAQSPRDESELMDIIEQMDAVESERQGNTDAGNTDETNTDETNTDETSEPVAEPQSRS